MAEILEFRPRRAAGKPEIAHEAGDFGEMDGVRLILFATTDPEWFVLSVKIGEGFAYVADFRDGDPDQAVKMAGHFAQAIKEVLRLRLAAVDLPEI